MIVPQWPVLFEGGEENPSRVLKALRQVGENLRQNTLDTLLVLSPFWIARSRFYVEASAHHSAQNDFVGYPVDLRYQCPGDQALANQLIEEGKKEGLPVEACTHWADVATSVPLKVLFPAGEKPIVPLSSSELPLEICLKWGQAIRHSGDIVHYITIPPVGTNSKVSRYFQGRDSLYCTRAPKGTNNLKGDSNKFAPLRGIYHFRGGGLNFVPLDDKPLEPSEVKPRPLFPREG
jgi:hypothetical protein